MNIKPHYSNVYNTFFSLQYHRKHPTPMAIQLHPQCLLGIQSILRI